MRLLGNIEARIDSKGRVFLPAAFRKVLEKEGVAVTVRRTLGSDIQASCGQLRLSAQAGTNTEKQ